MPFFICIFPSNILIRIRLKADCKPDAAATSLQLTKLQERKNTLRRKIKAWTVVQLLYMPEVAPLRAAAERAACQSKATTESFDIPLYLPSSLPSRTRTQRVLYEYEFRLRRAQAYEMLDSLRGHLQLRHHMYKYKDKNVRGQSASTRSNNLLSKVKQKADASAAQYRTARAALIKLTSILGDFGKGWDTSLKELHEEDIRAFTDDAEGETRAEKLKREKRKGLGEGKKKLSWIWMVTGVGWDGEDMGRQEGAFLYAISFIVPH